jgi:hypothetical protein
MGGQIPGCLEARAGLEFQLLGMSDYKDEMRLALEEIRANRTYAGRAPKRLSQGVLDLQEEQT